MQLADTKTVLNIVNKMVGAGAKYADKGANGTRLLAWRIYDAAAAHTLEQEIKDLFALVGFSNRVKVTTSMYNELARGGGETYLRINASYPVA